MFRKMSLVMVLLMFGPALSWAQQVMVTLTLTSVVGTNVNQVALSYPEEAGCRNPGGVTTNISATTSSFIFTGPTGASTGTYNPVSSPTTLMLQAGTCAITGILEFDKASGNNLRLAIDIGNEIYTVNPNGGGQQADNGTVTNVVVLPEPNTLALFTIGLITLIMVARHYQRRAC